MSLPNFCINLRVSREIFQSCANFHLKKLKMKFSVIILIAFAVGVKSAPQTETEIVDKAPITDEFAMELINGAFEKLEQYAPTDDQMDLKSKLISSLVLKKIDKDCILSEFKKHNFVQQIPSARQNLTNPHVKNEAMSEFVFMFFAGMCYKKLDVFLDFTFANLMTFNILLKAFIDEPEFKTNADNLRCASSYAVSHDILDPKVYNFNFEVSEDSKEECENSKVETRKSIDEAFAGFFEQVVHDNKECYQKLFGKVEIFVLKTVLLVQVDLSEAEKLLEKTSFIADFHARIEDFISCASAHVNEVEP